MKIQNTNMEMIRGDSESITLFMTDANGGSIPFEFGDTVYFTVKPRAGVDTITIQKIMTAFDQDGKVVIDILPEDTRALRAAEYVYDVLLMKANGRVTTIVHPSKFVIVAGVTDV